MAPDPDRIYEAAALELAATASRVLDFGAGRGLHGIDLRTPHNTVVGCDVDSAVLANPLLHRAEVVALGAPLPYDDGSFDLIVCRYVLEHVECPETVSAELRRILAPGGTILAITPNKYGYVAVAASIVPNPLHVAVLKLVQPGKLAEDTFPTRYRMNTRRDLERAFGALSYFLRASGPSAYHFGIDAVAKAFNLLHRILPEPLHTQIVFRYTRPAQS
ncbi:MAG: class I SAM-dependent methyltransferase [Brevundimonas sp.]|uniref:class I SAM-dependent methyltransferase n=1 Tax=Brevundimonas sp. TaxID=1871086 RepID=UPI002621979C|nr:class I SAM-dependent methyltransferase [Brevundimonas sp.]MDI6623186.1 class I SAM-dependent methyltransferase [Brevundimonas sp.]MDQ7811217.1 class I SAM-dependent methyltransferase [Brevundimonas sp.]